MSALAWRHVAMIVAAVVLALVGAPTAQADPSQTITEDLGANEVDAYLVQCGAGTTRFLFVRICDVGPDNDTQFMVQVIGRTPTGALGKVMLLTSAEGGCAGGLFSRGATSGAMSVLLTVTERNNAGLESYSLVLGCEDKNNDLVGNITVTKKQDQ